VGGCDQSDQALKDFRRDSVHGTIESGGVRSLRDAELREEVFVTMEVGTELAIGHS
jgi:hypothetical protein